MTKSGDGGAVYTDDPPSSDIVDLLGPLHIESDIIRDVALEQDVDQAALKDALMHIQSREECISLGSISETTACEIVAADDEGALYVVADAEACWIAEASAIGLSNAGRDAVVEAHRRQLATTDTPRESASFAFVLHCPEFPEDAVHRIRALRGQTSLGAREAQVLALKDEGLSPADIGALLGMTSGAVATMSTKIDQMVERARNTIALVDLPGVLQYSNLEPLDDEWLGLEWSRWYSLDRDDGEIDDLPMRSGFYRVRHPKIDGLIYIGESGAEDGLRGRIRSGLAVGIYDEEMPSQSRISHDGAQRLWAIQKEYGPGFEISVAMPPLAADLQHRRGIEAALLAVHRHKYGWSPLANFGRVIPGYRVKSTTQGETLSSPVDEKAPIEERSQTPPPWDHWREVRSTRWLGFDWTPPRTLSERTEFDQFDGCIYRLWEKARDSPSNSNRLTYIGATTSPMSRFFKLERKYESRVLVSVAEINEFGEGDEQHRRLRELTTDLIGVHYLATGGPPHDQF